MDALWQLMMGQTLIRNMQASPKYSEHYARVLVDLNGLYKVEELSKKADVLYEKEQRLDNTFHVSSSPNSMSAGDVGKIMDDKLQSFLSKFNQPSKSNDNKAPLNNNAPNQPKGQTFAERMADPAKLAIMQEKPCFNDRDKGECKTKVCPYKHTNKPRPITLSKSDLNGRGLRQSPL